MMEYKIAHLYGVRKESIFSSTCIPLSFKTLTTMTGINNRHKAIHSLPVNHKEGMISRPCCNWKLVNMEVNIVQP